MDECKQVWPSFPSTLDRLETAARTIIAGWILLGYFAPFTVFEEISARQFIILCNICYPERFFYYILCLGFVVVWLSYGSITRDNRKVRSLWWFTLLLFTPYIVQELRASMPSPALQSSSTTLSCVGLGLLASRICGSGSQLAKIIVSFGVVQAIYSLFYFFSGNDSFYSGTVLRAGGTFRRPFPLYVTMLFCIPIAIALIGTYKTFFLRLSCTVCTFLLFSTLCLTWYRGGLISAAFSISWLTLQVMHKNNAAHNRVILAVIISTLLLLCISSMVIRTYGTINAASSQRSVAGREYQWQEGWSTFQRHFLVGVGPGSLELPSSPKQSDDLSPYRHPHNLFLLWLSEQGILGGCILAGFMMALYKLERSRSSVLSRGTTAVWIGLAIAGLFDTPFAVGDQIHESLNVLFGALIGLTILL